MKVPICLVLAMLLSGCIPIGIRGTSITDAGVHRPAAVSPAGHTAANLPLRPTPDLQRV